MRLFKVIFDNNKAVLASQVDFTNSVSAEIEYPGGKKILRWLIVFAENEAESIATASKIANNIGFAH